MKTTLEQYTVGAVVEGFVFNELEGKGLYGLSGRLTIQPEYQRNYIYGSGGREEAVVRSVLAGYPLGLIYFNKPAEGRLEVLDGQQRITALGRFVTGKFAVEDASGMPQYFSSLSEDLQAKILDSTLLVYECEGTESEIKAWFQTINIAGVPLNSQELLNAIYSGPFVTAGRAEFSNSQNANIQKWATYIKGEARRQDFWERALEWTAGDKSAISGYMSAHRGDPTIAEVKTTFNSIIDWVSTVFTGVREQMKGLDWGRLYRNHHLTPYDPAAVEAAVLRLYADPFIEARAGIFEYVLGGETDARLLKVRLFDQKTREQAFERQTNAAKAAGESNCPLCALGSNANQSKLWTIGEMDADHVTAWSKGGETTAANCEMLCKSHNRAKGNA